jgi:hypothetical protein
VNMLCRFLTWILMVCAIAGTATLIAAQDSTPEAEASTIDIAGRWISLSCERWPGPFYVTRDLTFSEDGTYAGGGFFYGDERCQYPVQQLRTEGAFVVTGPSDVAEGAVEAEFTSYRLFVTPLVEDVVNFLNTAPEGDCGAADWEINVEQEVTDGCTLLGLGITPETAVEYEILLVRDDYLFIGNRPLEGRPLTPQTRPTTFQVPVIRVEGE